MKEVAGSMAHTAYLRAWRTRLVVMWHLADDHRDLAQTEVMELEVARLQDGEESWQGVIARSHCKESLQGVMARSRCKESLQGVIARSHGKESLQGVMARIATCT